MNSLWQNLFKGRRKKGVDEILLILGKIPIFDGLNNRELVQIERILHRREYQSEEVIFHQDDPGMGMYIIESGTVEIISEPLNHRLAELTSGEFFGELALLDESLRTATAIAKVPSSLLCFFQPALFDIIERNPRLGVKILFRLAYVIGERLKKSNEEVQELMKGCKV